MSFKKRGYCEKWVVLQVQSRHFELLSHTDNTGKKQVPSGVEIDRRVTSPTVKRAGDVTFEIPRSE